MRVNLLITLLVSGCAATVANHPVPGPVARSAPKATPSDNATQLRSAICTAPRWQAALDQVYRHAGYRPIFHSAGVLTADGKRVLDLLGDRASHGLEPWEPPSRRLAPDIRDVHMTLGVLRYYVDFKLRVLAHPTLTLSRRSHDSPQFVKEAAENLMSSSRSELWTAMRSWWPRHPHYEATRATLAAARTLTSNPFQAKRELRAGRRGKDVRALQEKLTAEGFFSGPLDSRFGAPLEAAVKRYQRARGAPETGTVGPLRRWRPWETAAALARTQDSHVAQIKLALQRWRESSVTLTGRSIRVNIPHFRVEVWEANRHTHSFRAIVGQQGRGTDRRTGHKFGPNRTPILQSAIDRVVLNPFWFVPARIAAKSLGKRDKSDLSRRGFGKRTIGGREQVFQKPGPKNALGKVKFIMPRTRSIYLHDTNLRFLFNKDRRDFSHGCVRVDEATTLATLLLTGDYRMSRKEIAKILRRRTSVDLPLNRPVPVSLEYNTVTFDADAAGNPTGPAILLADLYGYDDAFHKGALPYSMRDRLAAERRTEAAAQTAVAYEHMSYCPARSPDSATTAAPSPGN